MKNLLLGLLTLSLLALSVPQNVDAHWHGGGVGIRIGGPAYYRVPARAAFRSYNYGGPAAIYGYGGPAAIIGGGYQQYSTYTDCNYAQPNYAYTYSNQQLLTAPRAFIATNQLNTYTTYPVNQPANIVYTQPLVQYVQQPPVVAVPIVTQQVQPQTYLAPAPAEQAPQAQPDCNCPDNAQYQTAPQGAATGQYVPAPQYIAAPQYVQVPQYVVTQPQFVAVPQYVSGPACSTQYAIAAPSVVYPRRRAILPWNRW